MPLGVLLRLEVLSPEVLHPLDDLSFDPAKVSRVQPHDGVRELFHPEFDGFRQLQTVTDYSSDAYQTRNQVLRYCILYYVQYRKSKKSSP